MLSCYSLYLNECPRQASIFEINKNTYVKLLQESGKLRRQTLNMLFKVNENLCTMLDYYFFGLNGQPKQASIFEINKNMSMISCYPILSK
jgi:phage regulator Rha-like protein